MKITEKHILSFCLIGSICLLFFHKTNAQFANGADVSWLTQMEASGRKFYNNAGTQQDLFDILKGKCINSIRIRVWVNTAGGWSNKNDVLAKAIRAQNKGLRILIDFHYSDSWADPGQQNKPAAWVGHTIAQLVTDVATHTTDVMNTLKANGITPEWVQVGNETNNGMLWEEGRASTNMGNFAQLITSGYNAVKAVSPTSKVIVHIANGFDNALFRWMFDGLKNNNAKWDVIGMSLYPSTTNWTTLNSQCLTNMNDMVARYSKEVMIVEVGMDVTAATTCNSFLTDILQKTKSVTGGKGLGVFYWEPECYNGWQGYGMGAFDNTGAPTVAMDAFINGCNQPPAVSITSPASNASFGGPASIIINATASDPDGTVSKVDFYNGTTLIGTDATSTYSFTWTGVSPGTYTIIIKATDNGGAVTTSNSVTVTVSGALPVTLTSLDAIAQNDKTILLSWTTVEEKNDEQFLIERSSDGINFVPVGQMRGKGTTKAISEYTFTDFSPLGGMNYYRLIQKDTDGVENYSQIISASLSKNLYVELYPISFNEILNVFISSVETSAELELTDLRGLLLYRSTLLCNTKNELVPPLPPGMYLAKISAGDQIDFRKVIKE